MSREYQVIILEDLSTDAELIQWAMRNDEMQFDFTLCETREAFHSALDSVSPALIISDYSFPDFDGFKALEMAQARGLSCPFIFVSGTMGEEMAIDSLKRGATDYVLKDRLNRLLPAVKRALLEMEEKAGRIKAEEAIAIEREKLQELRQRMNRLSFLSALSAGVVHEITQPLNAIKVIADGALLWLGMGNQLEPEEVQENFSGIVNQVMRIEKIINHMRSFASMEREVSDACCEMREVIQGAMAVLGRQLKTSGIHIVEDLYEGPLVIPGEMLRIEEVLINLMSNAMQAFDSDRTADKRITIRTSREGNMAVIEVEDNAQGISDDVKDRIFEPFITTKLNKEGMGLGLSIVASIVHSVNGRIEAVNNSHGGATFRVTIPLLESGQVLHMDKEMELAFHEDSARR